MKLTFKNIEPVEEIKYAGYQFVDENHSTYAVTFADSVGVTEIHAHNLEEPLYLYTKDIPKLIKVLQAVYDEDNSGF